MTLPTPLRKLILAVALVVATPSPTAIGHTALPDFDARFPVQPDLAYHHNDWGDARSGGRRHRGNDLMAPKMAPVYAFADGVVASMGTNPRSGRFLRVVHDEDWTSYYIHLNNDNLGTDDGLADWSLTVAPGIEAGATVKAGQVIGWVGDSGNAEGSRPHLHFELHLHDRPVNPYPLLEELRQRDLAYLTWLQSGLMGQLGDHPLH